MITAVKVTAAESPLSNELVERHNMIIVNILDKILQDQQLDLDIALSWYLNTKNCYLTSIDSQYFSWYLVQIQNSLQYFMTNLQLLTLRCQ